MAYAIKSGESVQTLLENLTASVVEAVHPTRIILFGSVACGTLGGDSDLDILVVMPDGSHRRNTARRLYRHLSGFGVAKDIVVVTESDIREYGGNPSLVLRSALEDGKELYHAA